MQGEKKGEQSAQTSSGDSILFLMRHGAIATPGILAGKTDIALSELGREQVSTALASIEEVERCISSPLIRCHQSANRFCQQQSLPLAVDSRIQEMNFGDWDGRPYQDLWAMSACSPTSSIGDFWQNPWQNPPPNGETMENFVSRVDSWWQDFCSKSKLQNTLVFTHAGVIKHLLARMLNLPIPGTVHMSSIEVPYASVIKILLHRDQRGRVWPKLVL